MIPDVSVNTPEVPARRREKGIPTILFGDALVLFIVRDDGPLTAGNSVAVEI
ncbi:hypothetical protein SDC9_116966 [bioreactor metagenome]|uniref:Uncharacterized protein n=1 Tax=bioreactor metagenome TaxID=1076179 RepID=A0A645BWX1_9ZZZZ